ncbi:MAG: energy transducer TonB [Flavobacteriia bacterium]|nr:energy transducer TonB [Flavobacteriia bacterium]
MMNLHKPLVLAFVFVVSFTAFSQDEKEAPKSFMEITSFPVAPGCDADQSQDEIMKCFQTFVSRHISENFEYPEDAREGGLEGRVWLRFIVEADGSISNVEVVRTSGVASIDAEGVRVLQSLPKLSAPGYLDGRAVRMQYSIPINARI